MEHTQSRARALRDPLEPWRSSVGIKVWVAASGLLLWLWIALHAVGLLSMFGKPGAIDRYAALLHGAPWLLWPMRAGLALFAAVHVTGSMLLARTATAARASVVRAACS